ncbi:MAG: hypothetical protein AAF514_05730, partial [Verrucomicrobiota bacterium]
WISPDGISWDRRSFSIPDSRILSVHDLTVADREIVILTDKRTLSSIDGRNWSAVDRDPNQTVESITWDEQSGSFFSAGKTAVWKSGRNRKQWEKILEQEASGLSAIDGLAASNGSVFVWGKYRDTFENRSRGRIVETIDGGETWKTVETLPSEIIVNHATEIDHHTYFLGTNGEVLRRDLNGKWSGFHTGTLQELVGLGKTSDGFVTVGETGAVLTTDLTMRRWTNQNRHATNFQDSVWTGREYILVGDSGTILTSPDGQTWEDQDSISDALLYSVAHGNGRTVAVGAGGKEDRNAAILTSEDGKRWTPRQSSTVHWLYKVVWTGESFIAVGSNGAIISSPDGTDWTNSEHMTNQRLVGIDSDSSGNIVAVGGNGRLLHSSNGGRSWKKLEKESNHHWRDVSCVGAYFLAVGDERQYGYSPNGTDWTIGKMQDGFSFQSIGAGPLGFVVGSRSGSIGYLNQNGQDMIWQSIPYNGESIRSINQRGPVTLIAGERATLKATSLRPVGRSYETWASRTLPEHKREPHQANNPLEISNFAAYALGIDPVTGEGTDQLFSQSFNEEGHVVLEIDSPLLADAVVLLERTTDMSLWTPIAYRDPGSIGWQVSRLPLTFNHSILIEPSNYAEESPKVRITDESPDPRAFYRLRPQLAWGWRQADFPLGD